MKKILSFSSAKILGLCGVGLLMTLGAFWHYQMNQAQLNRMNVLNQGVGTCFNRISQTFTALMIKDLRSPYLDRGFMGLSDECLNETIKGINPFKQNVGKGYETLNKLISEVHWFHEKTLKIHAPMLAGQDLNPPMSSISEKFSKMEALKVNLVDVIDETNTQIREIQSNDEVLMGMGLIMFVIALSLLSLKEFNRIQLQKDIEKQALNLLKAGQANLGAIVDQLVERALLSQSMPVTAQIFKDYHGDLLERLATKSKANSHQGKEKATNATKLEEQKEVFNSDIAKTSLKEVLVTIQNIHSKNKVQLSDVRDVQLAVDLESFEQMMNAAVNKLADKSNGSRKIMISNQIHSDRSIINLFLAEATFTASELDFSQSSDNIAADSIDMNMMILKEMVAESGVQWHIENKSDRQGNITGMNFRFVINRVPKDIKSSKNLVSVVRGKKKDLAREMMN
jgi:hypothetical protein